MNEKEYLKENFSGEEDREEIRDLLELILTERISSLTRRRREEEPSLRKEEECRFREWDRLIQEEYPELAKQSQEFLDWITANQGQEIEAFYRYGLEDGIRMMRQIMKL